jgi:hypothetical protein
MHVHAYLLSTRAHRDKYTHTKIKQPHIDILSRWFCLAIALCIHGSPALCMASLPRGTLAFGQLGQAARLDAGYGTVEAPEAAGGISKPGQHQWRGLGV